MDKIIDIIKSKRIMCISTLLVLLLILVIVKIVMPKGTVRCDNSKAIAQLHEQNIADLTKAANDFMVIKQNDEYKIIFADEVDNNVDAEYAKFHYAEETDSVKVDYDKSKVLIESIDKDINEVQCTIPAVFKGFSSADKKATLTGLVQYKIHANDRGNISVTAISLTNMFRSNFKPIYNNREKKYYKFEYKTGSGEVIDSINELPLEEFGDFFNPLDY